MQLTKLLMITATVFFLIQVAAAQSSGAVCTNAQVSSQSNAELVQLIGNSSWVSNYYSYNGSKANPIVYNVNNYTKNTTNAYFILASYKVNLPGNLTMNPSLPILTFKTTNNTSQACSKLIFYSGEVVAPYNLSSLITPEQAKVIAQNNGYNVSLYPLTLILGSFNTTSDVLFLVPGYSYPVGNETNQTICSVEVNAQNKTFSSQPCAMPESGTGTTETQNTTIITSSSSQSTTIQTTATTTIQSSTGNPQPNILQRIWYDIISFFSHL